MALLICPECEAEVSERASICLHCGFPIAASVVEATYAKERAPRSTGGIFFALVLVAALAVAIAMPSATDAGSTAADKGSNTKVVAPRRGAPDLTGTIARPRNTRRSRRPLESVSIPAPKPIHDYVLAQRGHALHQQLMVEDDLDPDVYRPVLFGSATPNPRAAIYVATAAWARCSRQDRLELSHYAASLVAAHWAAPEVFAGYDSSDPNAAYFRRNAAGMTAHSWVILGGEVCDEGGAHADLRYGRVLASGARTALSPLD